jgi:hypothetical protein
MKTLTTYMGHGTENEPDEAPCELSPEEVAAATLDIMIITQSEQRLHFIAYHLLQKLMERGWQPPKS